MNDATHPATVARSVFDVAPPSFAEREVRTFLLDHYDLAEPFELSLLASERDQNWRVRFPSNSLQDNLVCKIANPAEQQETIEFQVAALNHLATVAPELCVPRVVPTRLGHALTTIASATGAPHAARVVTWLDGMVLASVERTPGLLCELGRGLGQLSAGFVGFGHPKAHQPDFLWNLDNAGAVARCASAIADDSLRRAVMDIFAHHANVVLPVLPTLRASVTHHDANDHNVVIDRDTVGLIDFGDMVFSRTINELAVGAAYGLMGCTDIVAGLRAIVGGYHGAFPITEAEADILIDLILTRLAVSISIAAQRAADAEANGAVPDPYLFVSQRPACDLIQEIQRVRPSFLRAAIRVAAGFPATSGVTSVRNWLMSASCTKSSPLPFDIRREESVFVSLAGNAPGTEFANNQRAYEQWLEEALTEAAASYALGAYDEDRTVYSAPQFLTNGTESRSVHLGLDFFVPAGTAVHSVLDGVVRFAQDNAAPLDYGPTLILEHRTDDGSAFWTLYGHLARETLTHIGVGQQVRAGETIGWIGESAVNGGWSPHLHLQLITDLLDSQGNYEGAGEPSRMAIWRDLCPDANLLTDLAPERFTHRRADTNEELRRRRGSVLGRALSISYKRPIHLVRGRGARLIDTNGREYLDFVNNVCHVGHAEPRVVAALTQQASELNTNTRYLHETIVELAERLTATLPDPLSVVYFVNSGSEANELALRIARTATGRTDVVCLDWGYHGNTGTLIDVSPYKFKRAGGFARKPWVHVAELADPFRGAYVGDPNAGLRYAESVRDRMRDAEANGGAAAFLAESISGCGGQVVFADGYLRAAFDHARAAGAICIADEVQVGLGRVGTEWWAFQEQNVVPDIVTIGKPFGNGHPLGAVVTTSALAEKFTNGMEFFNTFGGNPVSCAVGMAVLDVIEHDDLRANAFEVGMYLLDGFRSLQQRHEAIGDVRGRGLYLGIDLVTDRDQKTHATQLASDISNALRLRGVLVSTDGPFDNVLKIKPPLVVSRQDADVVLTELDTALACASRS